MPTKRGHDMSAGHHGSRQRRLSAILYIDVVGYARLIGADPDGTVQRMAELQSEIILPIVEARDGRVVRKMGDGALFEFASATNAIDCAVQIQRDNTKRQSEIASDRQLILRIGASLGEIVTDGTDIHGDGVNVAARLEAIAGAGEVYCSGELHAQVSSRLPLRFEHLGSRNLKNIARPVEVYRYAARPITMLSRAIQNTRFVAKRYGYAAVLAVFVVGIGAWVVPGLVVERPVDRADYDPCREINTADNGVLALPEKPSIAVLPFNNLTDNKGDYFVDGFTEDLITGLSKNRSLFVVNANSSFRYRSCQAAPERIARHLGVRYVLTGTVRTSGEKLRVNAALTDSQTRNAIWSDRSDGTLPSDSDLFAQQDSLSKGILAAVLKTIAPTFGGPAVAISDRNFEAYDQYLLGRTAARVLTPESQKRALTHFHKVLSLLSNGSSTINPKTDLTFAETHASIAAVYHNASSRAWGRAVAGIDNNRKLQTLVNRHLEEAQRLTVARPNPIVLKAVARQYYRSQFFDLSLKYAARAIELDPNNADGYYVKATALVFGGWPAEAITPIKTAQRLDPFNERFLATEGLARFAQGNFADAVRLLKRAFVRNPKNLFSVRYLIASLVRLEREDEARLYLRQMNQLRADTKLPAFTFDAARARSVFSKTSRLPDGRVVPYKARMWYLDAMKRILDTNNSAVRNSGGASNPGSKTGTPSTEGDI